MVYRARFRKQRSSIHKSKHEPATLHFILAREFTTEANFHKILFEMGLALAETLIEYSNTGFFIKQEWVFPAYCIVAILYSTRLGILWYALTCGFRLGMAALIGPAIWTGTADDFKCDTVLFGCENACYNNFMPILSSVKERESTLPWFNFNVVFSNYQTEKMFILDW